MGVPGTEDGGDARLLERGVSWLGITPPQTTRMSLAPCSFRACTRRGRQRQVPGGLGGDADDVDVVVERVLRASSGVWNERAHVHVEAEVRRRPWR
jgi:hypothetical protein